MNWRNLGASQFLLSVSSPLSYTTFLPLTRQFVPVHFKQSDFLNVYLLHLHSWCVCFRLQGVFLPQRNGDSLTRPPLLLLPPPFASSSSSGFPADWMPRGTLLPPSGWDWTAPSSCWEMSLPVAKWGTTGIIEALIIKHSIIGKLVQFDITSQWLQIQ